MEYPLQSGLPEYLKQRAITLGEGVVNYAWPSLYVKDVLDWIEINNHILLSVYVFTKVNEGLKFANNTWHYKGDRTKNRKENLVNNLLSAKVFISALEKQGNYYYEILFKNETKLQALDKEFLDKATIHRGDITYSEEDALEIVDRCKEENLKITYIEAYLITIRSIHPTDYMPYNDSSYFDYPPDLYQERYHVSKNADTGHWQEAKQWIRDRANQGWTFEIYYR
jgi:hypothetical protein